MQRSKLATADSRLLAEGTWVPTAAVHFAAVIGAVLADWMAVWAKG